MKICIHKITGEILETQFGEDGDILLRNNKQSFLEEELEVVSWTKEEYENNLYQQNYKRIRKQEIINQLNELDKKVIRPLLDNETERIEEIKAQKIILREELNNL
jgi:hypothetical protein